MLNEILLYNKREPLLVFSIYLLVFLNEQSFSKIVDVEKIEFCKTLHCENEDRNVSVCGFRPEGDGFRLKLFENECDLLKYGCSVDEERAYGVINKEYCDRLFGTDYDNKVEYKESGEHKLQNVLFEFNSTGYCSTECNDTSAKQVCGIREDGIGYRIKLFESYCELVQYNCDNKLEFIVTDSYICNTNEHNNSDTRNKDNNKHIDEPENLRDWHINSKLQDVKKDSVRNLIVVNSDIFGKYDNINDSIDTFFAASHVFDLPIKEVPLDTRRKLLKYAGPTKVFVPWIVKPKNISTDTFHRPTLSSCYHKCPIKCPDTYAPVCGVPGVLAREPSIMFQNHCFMDVAQCKMFWENKSTTSHSSSYVESSFLFCMGDEMNAVYRFLPAIRTLQHMGRLKKKGKFRAILKNFRFVSEFKYGRPKFMG